MFEHILDYYAHIVATCDEYFGTGRLYYLRLEAIQRFLDTQDDAQ